MVDREIVEKVKTYLKELSEEGIQVSRAILFGSHVKGTARGDSDIDLLLISPLFDNCSDEFAPRIWLNASRTDYRIEPFAVGEKRFAEDDVSVILEVARQEGFEIVA
ncbi:MAG: nucleotidyltransferase domain-containing protein [Bacteroidetes bacterium]|nr:nucleotidyltransferase domain-containing protein [Bacteroidota bacterium]